MPPRRTKRRFYAFRLTAKRLLCGVAAPLPPKGTAALIAKNGRSARFFAKRLPTTFVRLSAMRRFFAAAALPTFFGKAFFALLKTQTLGAFVCGECEVLSFFFYVFI